MGQFVFEPQQMVVYNESCICRVAEIVSRCFDGEHNLEYYKLCPTKAGQSSYYVPVAQAEKRLRCLMCEAEVLEMIDSLHTQEVVLSEDSKERKDALNQILRNGSGAELLGMLRTLRKLDKAFKSGGKRIPSADENAIRCAEERLYPEFALALHIAEDGVEEFIRARLGEEF